MKYKVIGYTDCLGFNVMPRQHELAARADTSSQHELATRARTSSQHEPARAQPAQARSTSQLEPRHKRARTPNQARPTLRSPCAALRPSPSPQDGRWRPWRIERKFSPVHAQRQREQQPSCTPRGTAVLLIKPQFAPHGSLLIYWPAYSTIHPFHFSLYFIHRFFTSLKSLTFTIIKPYEIGRYY